MSHQARFSCPSPLPPCSPFGAASFAARCAAAAGSSWHCWPCRCVARASQGSEARLGAERLAPSKRRPITQRLPSRSPWPLCSLMRVFMLPRATSAPVCCRAWLQHNAGTSARHPHDVLCLLHPPWMQQVMSFADMQEHGSEAGGYMAAFFLQRDCPCSLHLAWISWRCAAGCVGGQAAVWPVASSVNVAAVRSVRSVLCTCRSQRPAHC